MNNLETAQTSASDKVRVQIDFHRSQMGMIDQLMEVCSFDTRKDLFNNALSLFAWAVRERQKGREVGSIDRNERDIVTVEMPALTNVAPTLIAGRTQTNPHQGREEKTMKRKLREVVS